MGFQKLQSFNLMYACERIIMFVYEMVILHTLFDHELNLTQNSIFLKSYQYLSLINN